MKNVRWGALAMVLVAGAAAARSDAPPRSGGEAAPRPRGAVEWDVPAPVPPDLTPRRARARLVAPERARTPAAGNADPLASLRALAFASDEVRLRLAGGEERSVKAGDALADGVVSAAGDGLLVVERPAQAGGSSGAATVVLRFDAQGQPRIEVYHHANPRPVAPRPVQ